MKTHKVKAFFAISSGDKPNRVLKRQFLHSEKSKGFWAEIRDLSQKELLSNASTEKQEVIYITIGYNPAVLEHWQDLIFIDEHGKYYRAKTKPDEFNYSKGDMRITAYAFEDNANYAEDIYADKSS